jgi:hypothetical protein
MARGRGRGYSDNKSFTLRRATYNAEFAHRLGLLFWDHFLPVYQQQPVQVCACEPSGPPIGAAIQTAAQDCPRPVHARDLAMDGQYLPGGYPPIHGRCCENAVRDRGWEAREIKELMDSARASNNGA